MNVKNWKINHDEHKTYTILALNFKNKYSNNYSVSATEVKER